MVFSIQNILNNYGFLGQFAFRYACIGQFTLGYYVIAQFGIGKYVWSIKIKDPQAIEFFKPLLEKIMSSILKLLDVFPGFIVILRISKLKK